MPTFTFLEAPIPLTKEFSLDAQKSLTVTSYPRVFEVSSTQLEVPDLKSLLPKLRLHAGRGHCLLKGNVSRPLVSESRAGSTDPNAPTSWLCLDLDGVNQPSPAAFMSSIGLGEVSYILQWSASMGIDPNKKGLRCHILVELETPQTPALLKDWLQHLNLNTASLAADLTLTSTGMALKWPLDTTTCQNDKLIFIAPPVLSPGLVDPYPKTRYSWVHGTRDKANLGVIPSKAMLAPQIEALLNTLRSQRGMPGRKKFTYKMDRGQDYLANPEACTVTAMKTEREFVYFNLNGGDSWAYYHPVNNPKYIHNFKGEPVYRTQDLLPDYWASINVVANSGLPALDGQVYLAICEYKTGQYWKVKYDPQTDTLDHAPAKSFLQLNHFLADNNQPPISIVPDWEVVYEPSAEHPVPTLGIENKKINLFQPSEYMKLPPAKVLSPPPLISKIISHVLADDPEAIEHFYNWLAFIVQYRDRTSTAWLLHGTTSTGKGFLQHYILEPLVGKSNFHQSRMEQLEGMFNGTMHRKLLICIDEIHVQSSVFNKRIMSRLKNMITEPTAAFRAMYREEFNDHNYANFIFTSNEVGALEIAQNDRRFNIPPRQEQSITYEDDKDGKQCTKELPQLYHYLAGYKVDVPRAHRVLVSGARSNMQQLSQNSVDGVVQALLKGDLPFFVDSLPPRLLTYSDSDRMSAVRTCVAYVTLIKEILYTGRTRLLREDIFTLCEYCVGGMPRTPNKFTMLMGHHDLRFGAVWYDSRPQKGLDVLWNIDPKWQATTIKNLQPLFQELGAAS